MRILLVIGALTFGGAERVISNLANYFAENGCEVTLISISQKEISYKIDDRVEIVNGISKRNEIETIWMLRKILKKNNPDVILSFLTQINIATIIAALGTGIPVVVSERNDPKNMPTEKSRKFLRMLTYPFAKGIVFQTEQAKQYFNNIIQKKSVIIPNPIFLNVTALSLDNRKKEIISVGRLVPQKNHNLIIKSFSKLSAEFRDYTLSIYGEGSERKSLEKLISDLNLKGRVVLHGETNELHKKIRSARIFVMASDFEGMPNALMEAMALGIAPISTDCPSGGPSFLIKEDHNGILIPVGDEKKLLQSLSLLLSDGTKRENLSLNAAKITETLNPQKIFKEWTLFLQEKSRKKKMR